MRRFRFMLPVSLTIALVLSLGFVPGSFAEPLGAGLLTTFGVRSGNSEGHTNAVRGGFDLPVTIANTSSNPVPVTVQGTSNQPLTATIDGTVDTNATIQGTVSTNQANVPGSQPYQADFSFVAFGNQQVVEHTFTVPDDKILVIRYVSGSVELTLGQKLLGLLVETTNGGSATVHDIIPGQIEVDGSDRMYHFGAETWLEADPGTTVRISVARDGTLMLTSGGGFAISGYLLDPPA